MPTPLQPGELYWHTIEPYWKSVVSYRSVDDFLGRYAKVPTMIGHLIAAHLCRAEVENGGFLQFFSNSTGVMAPEVVVGFRAMGLEEVAKIVEKAMAVFLSQYDAEYIQQAKQFLGTAFHRSVSSEWNGWKCIHGGPIDCLTSSIAGFTIA